MHKALSKKETNALYKAKTAFFLKLGMYAYYCQFCIERKLYDNFPPSNEEFEEIETLWDEFLVKEYPGKKLKKKLKKKVKEQEESKVGTNRAIDFLKNPVKNLDEIELQDLSAFTKISLHCDSMGRIYNLISKPNAKVGFELLIHIKYIGYLTMSKVNELIGYWVAKLEEKQRSLKAAAKKTEQKRNRLDIVKNLFLKEFQGIDLEDKRAMRSFRMTAMKKADVYSERTIQNYIKELQGELDKERI